MNTTFHGVLVCATLAASAATARAQDWPQWLGSGRDARATDFKPRPSWPESLTQKWKVTVGEGVATPALMGSKLFVFSRQEGYEVLRCLNASDGKELWSDKYESLGASGPAQGFSGPRSSPAVANGKVLTLGVRGMLSCVDAETGKVLWRKDDFQAYPNFHPSSSPIIVGGLGIAQLGGRENGAIAAYDLATGTQKWKWNGSSPGYASPVLLTSGAAKYVIAWTEKSLVAVNSADGSLAWELASASPQGGPGGGGPGGPGGQAGLAGAPGGQGAGPGGPGGGRGMGGGRDYKASTPLVNGQEVIVAGRGIKAFKLENSNGKVVGTEIWNNPDRTVQFNTPILKSGNLYGIAANNELFCVNAKDGTSRWNVPLPGAQQPGPAPAPRAGLQNRLTAASVFGQVQDRQPEPGGPRGPGGPGGRRFGGGGGGAGYGSLVDAGSVLLALSPSSQLIVFAPNDKEFKSLATYKIAETPTHAYPIASGNRLFIKDRDSVILWTIE